MKCSITGCPGEYEPRTITHTVRRGDRVVVIDHVPAEVCGVCGDVLLRPETIRQLEMLLKRAAPSRSVPLYEYALTPAASRPTIWNICFRKTNKNEYRPAPVWPRPSS